MVCVSNLQKKSEEFENKRKREANLVIPHAPSADNSNLSADGDDSFISVEMDSAMPSPFSEVRKFTDVCEKVQIANQTKDGGDLRYGWLLSRSLALSS